MMWWEGEDPELTETVDRLAGLFVEGELPGISAIGSSWDTYGRRTLYVGVHADRDQRPWSWAPGIGGVDALTRRLIGTFGPLPPRAMVERPEYLEETGGAGVSTVVAEPSARQRLRSTVRALITLRTARRPIDGIATLPLELADPETQTQLQRLDVPWNTRVGYIGPLIQAGDHGLQVWPDSEKPGTVGCTFELDGTHYATTAGHVAKENAELRCGRKRPLFDARRACGSVIASTAPQRPDRASSYLGLDIGVVELSSRLRRSAEVPTLADPRDLHDNEWLVYNGGKTGSRRSYIVATDRVVGEPPGPITTNVVQVTGKPGRGAGNEGDSGTAVFREEGSLVGHLVVVGGLRDGPAMQQAFIQHARVAMEYVEGRVGPINSLFGDLGR